MAKKSFDDLVSGFEPIADVEAINTLSDRDKSAKLRLDQLVSYPGNREVSPEKAELMAESLRICGQLQDILVRPVAGAAGKYEICAGHHRYLGQSINAELYPDEPSYRFLDAKIRDMSDDEMAVANAIANFYMNPPDAEERAALYEVLKARVPSLRLENPERYAGVPTAQIVADMVNDMGGSTSRATVNRDLKAARDAEAAREALSKVAPAWREKWEAGEVDDSTVVRLSALEQKVQKAVYRDWRDAGGKKAYLKERIALTDATDAEQLMYKTLAEANAMIERLLRIRRQGYYVEERQLEAMRSIIDEIRAQDEQEALA